MSARNKRQLIGGLVGASIGIGAYALAFRNDGDVTIDLLLSFGLILGGIPGSVVGALVGALVDSCSGRRPPHK